MPPVYSPDGTRFWTGTRWIPASEVLGPPPAGAIDPLPPPPPEPPRARAPRRTRRLAAALGALLVVLVAVGGYAIDSVGRQLAPQTGPVPSAAAVLALPFTDGVKSAGILGTLTTGGVTEDLAGSIQFAPGRALAMSITRDSALVAQWLDCDGLGYRLALQAGAWDESPRVSRLDTALGWAGGPPPQGLRVAGQQMVGGEPAWHLTSPSGAAWWIGVRTGHPLRFQDRTEKSTVEVTFTGFDRQPAITDPSPDDVSTLSLQGAAGELVAGPDLEVELSMMDVTPQVLNSPPAGYEYQAIYLSYQNLAPEPVKLDNLLTLTGPDGARYQEAPAIQVPPALPRNQDVAPGQTVAGWDVFLVARGVSNLTLRVGSPPGQENDLFLLSIPLF